MPDANTSLTDSFNTMVAIESARLDRFAFDDYRNAISGAETGRYRKHIKVDDIDPTTGEKKKSAEERTLDWLLLNDAAYAKAYNAAKTAVDDTLAQASKLLE